jgi:ADP-heptose:LPS heptosyltransferase
MKNIKSRPYWKNKTTLSIMLQNNPSYPHKILVIKLSALGDFVQALGAMKAIRASHISAHITLLTTKPFEDFARKSGYFDDIWIDPRPKWTEPKKWLDLKKQLKKGNFDRVYDLQTNDRTNLYFKLFGSSKPEWVGTAKGASHLNADLNRKTQHAFDRHKSSLALADINDVQIDSLDWIETDISRFDLQKPYILIVPGSAPSRPLKRWPARYFGEICIRLRETNFQPVLLGTQDEAPVIEEIMKACPQALNLCGQTSLYDIVTLGRHAAGCLSNDTGPAHMIAPTGCNILVLFSKDSSPVLHKPLGENVTTLQKDTLDDLMPEDVWPVLQKFLISK